MRFSFEAGDGRGIEREGNDNSGIREGKLVGVCRKRQRDNQSGRTRGEQEVELPA